MSEIGVYEAKTNLAALINRVQKGERITITRHGAPVAVLIPAAKDKKTASHAIADIRNLRKGAKLGGLNLRTLISEGRR